MAKKRATPSKRRKQRVLRGGRRRVAPPPSARAIEAMLAELAHEIRTPLTGILALGELLTTSGLAQRERGWAAAIKNTAEHLALLTSLIVDAARTDSKGLILRREPVYLRRFIDALVASLAGRADAKGLKPEIMVAPQLPEAVICDPLRLRSALENLIDNAVKFTESGSIRLDVTSEQAARGRVRLAFSVSDSGIGLAAAEIKRLFRPFGQASEETARRYGGAGLGLVFVKRVARAMAGNLVVRSKPGEGTSFRLTITVDPVATNAGPSASEPPSALPAGAAPRALNILCAEDNPYGRVVLNTILTELGHRADFVGTGAAAVEAAARGGYDVVLMDVTLPDLDGLEAARRIRALDRPAGAVALIGISGQANLADQAAGRAAGMDGYLVKPVSPAALTRVLASLASSPQRLV